jgi:hypothetical protein
MQQNICKLLVTCSRYYELRASTRFERYLLILRRRYTKAFRYTACVLC